MVTVAIVAEDVLTPGAGSVYEICCRGDHADRFGELARAVSDAILAGHRVLVVSRHDVSYASCAVAIAGIDFNQLVANVTDIEDLQQREGPLLTVDCRNAAGGPGAAAQQIRQSTAGTADTRLWLEFHNRVTDDVDPPSVMGPLDWAIQRLRAGRPEVDDVRLLADHGVLAAVREYARPHDLGGRPDLTRLITGPVPAWADLNDQAWLDLCASGDIGQLLDVPEAVVADRLASQAVRPNVARLIASGAPQYIRSVLADLPDFVRRELDPGAVPVSRRTIVNALARSINARRPPTDVTVAALQAAWVLTPAERAYFAWWILRTWPTRGPLRRALQQLVFQGLEPEDRRCAVQTDYHHGIARLPLRVITKYEYDHDPVVRSEYLACVRRLFPPMRFSTSASLPRYRDGKFVSTSLVYEATAFTVWGTFEAGIWYAGKDFSYAERSGPRPRLSLIEFPATVIAAYLGQLQDVAVAAVPSSEFSEAKPAQTSERLARRAADLAARLLLEPDGPRSDSRVVVVDDQLTDGTTSRRAAERYWPDVEIATYSASERSRPFTVKRRDDCRLRDAAKELGLAWQCPVHDLDARRNR